MADGEKSYTHESWDVRLLRSVKNAIEHSVVEAPVTFNPELMATALEGFTKDAVGAVVVKVVPIQGTRNDTPWGSSWAGTAVVMRRGQLALAYATAFPHLNQVPTSWISVKGVSTVLPDGE